MGFIRSSCLAMAVLVAAASASKAEPIELTAPDGRTVSLFDDFTWEYKRPAPTTTEDTVDLDSLIKTPGYYLGEEIVVTGPIVRVLGAYRLTTVNGQNNVVVDLARARRADQVALQNALDAAAWSETVKVQVRGKVERSTITHHIVASDLVLMQE